VRLKSKHGTRPNENEREGGGNPDVRQLARTSTLRSLIEPMLSGGFVERRRFEFKYSNLTTLAFPKQIDPSLVWFSSFCLEISPLSPFSLPSSLPLSFVAPLLRPTFRKPATVLRVPKTTAKRARAGVQAGSEVIASEAPGKQRADAKSETQAIFF
jgi:hypothetical protein